MGLSTATKIGFKLTIRPFLVLHVCSDTVYFLKVKKKTFKELYFSQHFS